MRDALRQTPAHLESPLESAPKVWCTIGDGNAGHLALPSPIVQTFGLFGAENFYTIQKFFLEKFRRLGEARTSGVLLDLKNPAAGAPRHAPKNERRIICGIAPSADISHLEFSRRQIVNLHGRWGTNIQRDTDTRHRAASPTVHGKSMSPVSPRLFKSAGTESSFEVELKSYKYFNKETRSLFRRRHKDHAILRRIFRVLARTPLIIYA